MAGAKKLETIFYNGQPDGIRSIRRHLSTMTTYVIPRPLLSEAKTIKGTDCPGIYFLINEDEENKIAKIYVGQTRNGIARLEDHNQTKVFWNKAIMFLSDSKTFSLDIISGLEEYAIVKAYESNRYSVENKIKPKYEIDEYDFPIIEEIYEEIQFIMATQGYKMNSGDSEINQSEILHTTRNGIRAIGIYEGDCFEVLKGSEVHLVKPVKLERYNRLRSELVEQGKILEIEGKMVLQVTLEFKTPSGASDFVLGGSTNGWVEWKNANGKTLDELYRK